MLIIEHILKKWLEHTHNIYRTSQRDALDFTALFVDLLHINFNAINVFDFILKHHLFYFHTNVFDLTFTLIHRVLFLWISSIKFDHIFTLVRNKTYRFFPEPEKHVSLCLSRNARKLQEAFSTQKSNNALDFGLTNKRIKLYEWD